MARRTYVELERDARRGRLTYRTVTLYLNKGWITPDEARELNRLIAEQQQASAAAPAVPASVPAMPPFPLRTIEIVAEEIRSNRINDGETVDNAWAYAVGLRDACVRWPRDERKVTEGLDPFTLRVLRFVYNRRFNDLGVAEGVRIISLCSYADLRRIADQGAHEKRLRVLDGNFDHGVLKAADVGDASKKGLGIPVTILDGQVLTGLLVQHYNRGVFIVSSFEELESALTSPAGQGGLDIVAVQKAKESGKLLQVPSPEVWERSREERRLQDLLGPEYWYLNSATGPERTEFAILVDRHRMVLPDGSRDPRPILGIIAERLSGDGVVVTEDDLWAYFGGRPAAGAALPPRTQSVFFSEKLAEHFAGRLELPVEVVRRFFTRHHDLAEEIERRQSSVRRTWRKLFGVGAEEQKTPFFVDLAANTIMLGLAGLLLGAIPGVILSSPILLAAGSLAGAVGGVTVLRLLLRGSLRIGIVGVLLISLLIILGSCGAINLISLERDAAVASKSWERAEEMGLPLPKGIKEQRSAPPAPSLQERTTKFVAGKLAPAWSFAQHNMRIFPVIGGVLLIGGLFTIIALFVYGERRGYM